ncbi:MAG: hypothetical protein GF349_02675 [Candidatus Magasanikbacteria bacterium]|nr:hypothetical protein [Candidatus Magasanikbacteria bacterium]
MNRQRLRKIAKKYEKKDVLYKAEEIERRVRKVSHIIAKAHRGTKDLVLVGVLNGAAIFTRDLLFFLHEFGMSPQLGFIGMSLFDDSNKRRLDGPRITSPLSIDVTEKTVMVAEDVIETGDTMRLLIKHLKSLGVRKVEIVTVMANYGFKPNKFGLPKTHICFRKIPEHFIAGYGMDNKGMDRGYPHIYRVYAKGQPRPVGQF